MVGTDATVCELCGEKTETGRGSVCYGCHLTAIIPNLVDFQRQEKYVYVSEFGHRNATDRPATGHPWLDSTPLRISQMGFEPGELRPW